MSQHTPVLLNEVLAVFHERQMSTFVDGTLGAGGHAKQILETHPNIKHFIGIDQDPHARALSSQRLAPFSARLKLVAGNFSDLDASEVDGILLDLGVSSMQLDQAQRGFSFMRDGPLDMRMNPDASQSAADLINSASIAELTTILRDYGEVPRAGRVAAALVAARPLATTLQLVEATQPYLVRKGRSHPATCLFQALRIAVNDELNVLQRGLEKAISALAPGGRLAVISFHSLEDRIVKQTFRESARGWTPDPSNPYSGRKRCAARIQLCPARPILPTREEIRSNPRARSAKLRVCEKLCS